MRGIVFIGLFAICMAAGTARGDAWTNAAGHAIQAELVRLEGEMAVFKLADGTRMEMPLSSLSAESRARAESESGRFRIPAPLRGDYDNCARTLKRLRQLRDANRLEADEYNIRRQAAISMLKVACLRMKTDGKLTPEDEERILSLAWTN